MANQVYLFLDEYGIIHSKGHIDKDIELKYTVLCCKLYPNI